MLTCHKFVKRSRSKNKNSENIDELKIWMSSMEQLELCYVSR